MTKPVRLLPVLAVCLASIGSTGALRSQEAETAGNPCSRFKWPLSREQTWLSSSGLRRIAPGETLAPDSPAAVLGLKRYDAADLPQAASRTPKPGTYATTLSVPAPLTPGLYQVTLSDDGWIDLFQQGEAKEPVAHTGQKGCPGLRKSLRFQLETKPILIQITDAKAETLRISVAPVEERR